MLATGRGRALSPDAPAGVHRLRTLADALALRAELLPGRRLAVVGAGLVGSEVASTASQLGVDVVPPTASSRCRPPSASMSARSFVAPVRTRDRPPHRHPRDGFRIRRRARRGGPPRGRQELAATSPSSRSASSPRASWSNRPGRAIPTDACGRTAVAGVFAAGDAPCRTTLARPLIRHRSLDRGGRRAAAAARAVLGHEAPY